MPHKQAKWSRWLNNLIVVLTVGCLAAYTESQATKDTDAQVPSRREKRTKAQAIFQERCKSAGVFIKTTVTGVEGIELVKVRQPIPWGGKEYFDPTYPEAAMAAEYRGDEYIKQFLMSEFRPAHKPEQRGQLGPHLTHNTNGLLPPLRGYRFVEYSDATGTRYRCEATWKDGESNWTSGQHQCNVIKSFASRFAIDYEDLADPQDRAFWIAGTRLKIVDKRSGEVIAQLTRFVWDSGFGSAATGRWPWSDASTSGSGDCPRAEGIKSDVSRKFVDTVLIPKQGD